MIEGYAQIASFIKDNQPFEANSVVAVLNGYFVDSVRIAHQVEIKEGVMVFSAELELTYPREKKAEAKVKGKTAEGKEEAEPLPRHWFDDYKSTDRTGYAIAPLFPLTKETVTKYQAHALLNALSQFGAEVEELDDFDAFTPYPPAEATAARASAPAEAARTTGARGPVCEECGGQVVGYTSAKGTEMTPDKQVQMTQRNYNKILCRTCNAKHRK